MLQPVIHTLFLVTAGIPHWSVAHSLQHGWPRIGALLAALAGTRAQF